MITAEYLQGMQAAANVWPLQTGAYVESPYAGKGGRAEVDFTDGFYAAIQTLTVIDLMKKKDEPEPKTEFDPYRGFKVGDAVKKVQGYAFPGEIVSLFTTTEGEERCVVELKADGVGSLLHIFNLGQIAHAKSAHQDG